MKDDVALAWRNLACGLRWGAEEGGGAAGGGGGTGASCYSGSELYADQLVG